VSGNLIKIQRDRTELVDLLHRTIQELKDKGTFSALAQRVDDEMQAQKRLNQVRTHEEELKAAVERLERGVVCVRVRVEEAFSSMINRSERGEANVSAHGS
jgi:hypothetical protein